MADGFKRAQAADRVLRQQLRKRCPNATDIDAIERALVLVANGLDEVLVPFGTQHTEASAVVNNLGLYDLVSARLNSGLN